jgi:hypothetical protein
MANPNRKADEIIGILTNRIGKLALVYEGWPNRKHVKDLRRTRGLSEDLEIPEVSITEFGHWPNHLEVNVWTQSSRERDEISQTVIDILNQIEKEQKIEIREISADDITFEEKGSIRPGKWDIIKGSKPVFRKLIQLSLLGAETHDDAEKTQLQTDDGVVA